MCLIFTLDSTRDSTGLWLQFPPCIFGCRTTLAPTSSPTSSPISIQYLSISDHCLNLQLWSNMGYMKTSHRRGNPADPLIEATKIESFHSSKQQTDRQPGSNWHRKSPISACLKLRIHEDSRWSSLICAGIRKSWVASHIISAKYQLNIAKLSMYKHVVTWCHMHILAATHSKELREFERTWRASAPPCWGSYSPCRMWFLQSFLRCARNEEDWEPLGSSNIFYFPFHIQGGAP